MARSRWMVENEIAQLEGRLATLKLELETCIRNDVDAAQKQLSEDPVYLDMARKRDALLQEAAAIEQALNQQFARKEG